MLRICVHIYRSPFSILQLPHRHQHQVKTTRRVPRLLSLPSSSLVMSKMSQFTWNISKSKVSHCMTDCSLYVSMSMFMYVCLCMYVYVCTSMYVRLCMYVYECTSMNVHLCMYIYVCTSMYVHVYASISVCLFMYVYVYGSLAHRE